MHQNVLNWILAASFYIYQFILRVAPTVLSQDLMSFFQITAGDMGEIGAIGLFTYALFQIPGGLIMDTWGARKTILVSILACLSGNILFALTPTFHLALLGRALYGIGAACAFLGVSKVNSQWFAPARASLLFGFTMTAGTIGALLGARPLLALVTWLTWRPALLILSGIGLVLVATFFFLFKDHPSLQKTQLPGETLSQDQLAPSVSSSEKEVSLQDERSHLFMVFKNPQAYLIGISALGVYLTISVLGDLWGVPFLKSRLGVSTVDAAQMNSCIYVGLCLGGLTLTRILSLKPHFSISLIRTSLLAIAVLVGLLIWMPGLNSWTAYGLLLGMGFFCGAEMVCFSRAVTQFSSSVAGTVTGFINFMVMMGGALVQQAVGWLLDHFWDGSFNSALQIREYSQLSYQKSLTLYLMLILFSFGVSFLLKDPRKQAEEPLMNKLI